MALKAAATAPKPSKIAGDTAVSHTHTLDVPSPSMKRTLTDPVDIDIKREEMNRRNAIKDAAKAARRKSAKSRRASGEVGETGEESPAAPLAKTPVLSPATSASAASSPAAPNICELTKSLSDFELSTPEYDEARADTSCVPVSVHVPSSASRSPSVLRTSPATVPSTSSTATDAAPSLFTVSVSSAASMPASSMPPPLLLRRQDTDPVNSDTEQFYAVHRAASHSADEDAVGNSMPPAPPSPAVSS